MSVPPEYLKKVLEADERAICRSGLHWIYLVSGLFWLLGLGGIGWASDYALWYYFGAYIPAAKVTVAGVQLGLTQGWIGGLFTAGGLFIFMTEFVKYMAADLIVTSKRLVYKTGLIRVKLDETDLSDVRGIHVDQGWLGRFLNYGKLHLDCRFVADVYIPYVRAPYVLVKHMQKIKSDLEVPSHASHETEHIISQTIINVAPTGHVTINQPSIEQAVPAITAMPVAEEPVEDDLVSREELLDEFKTRS